MEKPSENALIVKFREEPVSIRTDNGPVTGRTLILTFNEDSTVTADDRAESFEYSTGLIVDAEENPITVESREEFIKSLHEYAENTPRDIAGNTIDFPAPKSE